ncbi:nitroreductase family protein [Pelagicoccus sp. NFK12]|uniref:Nitroreductase family protein n=1 Tax=Pelagicoccus enzymogenes TaxID=2773457 RepID=A0A927FAZ9_9BACT|nr:nitroreductase family protein [Pelagicoccus enzymogenes]MBD5781778.1 nitroreductase family protein [Pelagicoccus enzymogenes]
MPTNTRLKNLNEILCQRVTTKAMDEQAWPVPPQDPQLLDRIIAAAGEAPFHKPASRDLRKIDLPGIQPWRCYTLDARQCRKLRQHLLDAGDTTKIPKLLAVADYLIQATWLPNPKESPEETLFEPSIQNMEHIAGASAAIQNMLLAATALEIPNYWSSGGALRSPEVFELMGIPSSQVLLGSLFLFPKELSNATLKSGSLRPSRSPQTDWARSIEL